MSISVARPEERIDWLASFFLIMTFALSLTLVPFWIWCFGITWLDVVQFVGFFILTGMSITFGYHRLFAHRAFKAPAVIRFLTLVFGAAAFENSALDWVADHRRHHKHTDHEDDPYNISKGFFHAHIGWILLKPKERPPYDNSKDLLKDKLVMWQHRHWHLIAIAIGFVLPTLIGLALAVPMGKPLWQGTLAGLLFGGVLRVTCVQHCTFFINSLCHCIGKRPYDKKSSARDSGIMALFTFGEGYHNYHHSFQHDYRNGIRPWHFDPTKWTIWTLSKLGLASDLRRVEEEKITEVLERSSAPVDEGKQAGE